MNPELPLPPRTARLRGLLRVVLVSALLTACNAPGGGVTTTEPTTPVSPPVVETTAALPASPEVMASRATVPVLCYHQIREWRPGETEYSRGLTTPPALFAAQMEFLATDGWTPISPEAYADHITRGTALPPKPVLLTFDDGHITQITEALPVLRKHGFTATFFLMTVVIGKEQWIKSDDIKQLDAEGFTIGAHTYDHQNVAKLATADFETQVLAPRRRLEALVGHPIRFFAYPFGAWNPGALSQVAQMDFDAAFQLTDHKMDSTLPQLTLRRQITNSLTGIEAFKRQVSAPVDTTTVQR